MNYKRGHSYPGLYLQLDGPDGSGKSTQFRKLVKYLEESKCEVVEVREPGGTHIGEQIRRVLLDPANKDEVSDWTELFLFVAARAQLAHQKIIPALSDGKTVLSDRGYTSSYAYQGVGGGLPLEDLLKINYLALQNTLPDRIYILDVNGDVALKRMNPLLRGAHDRIESKGMEFQEKIRQGYLKFAIENPEITKVIDTSNLEFEDILNIIKKDLTDYINYFPDLKVRYSNLNQNP